MRSIELYKIELPNKHSVYILQRQYCVFLGNDARRYFTDMKDAKKFLADTNRLLTDRLHELNYLYSNIFTEYRGMWFYLDDKKKEEEKIIESFKTIDNLFYKAATKSHTPNANVFTFRYVMDICYEFCDVILFITEILRERKLYADLRRLMTFDRQIKLIVDELTNYGKIDIPTL